MRSRFWGFSQKGVHILGFWVMGAKVLVGTLMMYSHILDEEPGVVNPGCSVECVTMIFISDAGRTPGR
eukprot:2117037-Prymnesium_polylepis.1